MASGVRDCQNVSCQLCGAVDNLMLCSRCRYVWYCSKEHQKYDWKYHKKKCHKFEDRNPTKRKIESSSSMPVNNPIVDYSRKSSAEPEGIIQPFMAASIHDHDTSVGVGERDVCEVSQTTNNNISKLNFIDNIDTKQDTLHNNKKDSSGSLVSNTSSSSELDSEIFTESGSSESYILQTDSYSLSTPPIPHHSGSEHSKEMPQNLTEANPASKQAYISACSVLESRNKSIAEYAVNCLNTYGVCVVDGFLGESKAEQILKDVLGLHESGMFTKGQLVNSETKASRLIRGDIITWVEGNEKNCANINFLISALDAIISQCAGRLDKYEISGRTKAMIACYPGCSTGYMKHVDNPNKDGRCITTLYYLNKNWDAINDGGILRIYPEGQSRIASIEPKFDRLLFFWSDRRNPHEVMPAFRTRYAITVWYYDAEERRRAVKRFYKFKENGENPKRIMLPLSSSSKHTS